MHDNSFNELAYVCGDSLNILVEKAMNRHESFSLWNSVFTHDSKKTYSQDDFILILESSKISHKNFEKIVQLLNSNDNSHQLFLSLKQSIGN